MIGTKSNWLLVIMFFVFSLSVFSNPNEKKYKQRVINEVDKMVVIMNLDDSQRSSVLSFRQAYDIKNRALIEKYGKGSEQHLSQRKKLINSFRVLLLRVCSKDQMDAWNEYNASQKSVSASK